MQIYKCVGTKVDISGAPCRRRGVGEEMGPGPEKEPLPAAGFWRHRPRAQPVEVHDGIAQENVIPRADMVHGNIDIAMLTLDVNRPPVRTIIWVGEIITQIR